MTDGSQVQQPLLVIDKITVSYPNRRKIPVLSEFSLCVPEGQFLAVIGPSGCGKSTLLHAIGGFARCDSGSMRLNGALIEKPSIEVGFVCQQYALFPWLTVEANIAFGLRSRKLSDAESRAIVHRLLETIGLVSERKNYPEQLSGGMQQRVALARAMAPRPAMLLLDEPFSSLDTETRQRMRDLLLRLWKETRTTILFVTHDIEEALLLSDEVVMLERDGVPPSTVPVPFPRPRERTCEFLATLGTITQHYGVLAK